MVESTATISFTDGRIFRLSIASKHQHDTDFAKVMGTTLKFMEIYHKIEVERRCHASIKLDRWKLNTLNHKTKALSEVYLCCVNTLNISKKGNQEELVWSSAVSFHENEMNH
jgi:hypothetical protein